MTEHETDDSNSRPTLAERYNYAEYEAPDGSVSIIQDTQNEDAWIRTTHTVAVER